MLFILQKYFINIRKYEIRKSISSVMSYAFSDVLNGAPKSCQTRLLLLELSGGEKMSLPNKLPLLPVLYCKYLTLHRFMVNCKGVNC